MEIKHYLWQTALKKKKKKENKKEGGIQLWIWEKSSHMADVFKMCFKYFKAYWSIFLILCIDSVWPYFWTCIFVCSVNCAIIYNMLHINYIEKRLCVHVYMEEILPPLLTTSKRVKISSPCNDLGILYWRVLELSVYLRRGSWARLISANVEKFKLCFCDLARSSLPLGDYFKGELPYCSPLAEEHS